jgi:hypothetical protein
MIFGFVDHGLLRNPGGQGGGGGGEEDEEDKQGDREADPEGQAGASLKGTVARDELGCTRYPYGWGGKTGQTTSDVSFLIFNIWSASCNPNSFYKQNF